jgi:hypothetical protein
MPPKNTVYIGNKLAGILSMTTGKKWQDMTWQEKREARFKRRLSPFSELESPAAEEYGVY